MNGTDTPGTPLVERIGTKRDRPGRAAAILAADLHAGGARAWLEFGSGLCELYRAAPRSASYQRGLRYLERAAAASPQDAVALATLAGATLEFDAAKGRALYRAAFRLDPTDREVLVHIIDQEARHRDAGARLAALEPKVRAALRRPGPLAGTGDRAAREHFEWSVLQALGGRSDAALAAAARGLAASPGCVPGARTLEFVRRLQLMVGTHGPHLERLGQLLALALVVRSRPRPLLRQRGERERATPADRQAARKSAQTAARALAALRSTRAASLRLPVLIVVGKPRARGLLRSFLEEARAEFEGTVIGNGVAAPPALEPLQVWIDLVLAGAQPTDIRVLGIGAEAREAIHYPIALALGSRVGIVEGSGGEAASVDSTWPPGTPIMRLPGDRFAVRGFVASPASRLGSPWRDRLARVLDAVTSAARGYGATGPGALPWELHEASAARADELAAMLQRAGFELVPLGSRTSPLVELGSTEIEVLAQAEHGRWTIEQLIARTSKEPVRSRLRPDSAPLLAWQDLSEPRRETYRQFIGALPRLLAEAGLELERHA